MIIESLGLSKRKIYVDLKAAAFYIKCCDELAILIICLQFYYPITVSFR